ncbi:MAG: acyl-CoA dehydrogenase [Deltaproteobacteria bacterium]|nr:MAG: acyl-CoA dehydrogenase [Deltaproteobacteria bacterium]
MNLGFSAEDEAFRDEVRTWLHEHLVGDFAKLKGRGGLGDMDAFVEERIAWEKELATGGWTCLGWPTEHGGRGASLFEEVIFAEEYARARAPGRAGHIGEGLLGPTVIHFGTPEQQARFLPPIVAGEEMWCQGYSEPGAGSDLASLKTRAERDGDEWVITGQKIWTSLAEDSDWCFVLARTNPEEPRHKGISCLLVPMDQPGIEVVPIRQITGNAEFAEVFFDGARAKAEHMVGPENGGWKVAMGTLAFERGASTLGQQLSFKAELERVIEVAKQVGTDRIPAVRERIAEMWMRLEVMRLNALRTLSAHDRGELPREAYITKLYWATWHRDLGELAMDVLGTSAAVADPAFADLHRLFLWSRSDTIYAGTNQIQKNLIAQRALGLPR